VRPSEQKATLTQVTLKNFKSYRNANLPIAPLTFLIGANASGKSNAIEVLRFVHGIASGRYLDDVYKDLHDAGTLRGSRATLVWDQKSPFSICLTANIESQKMIWSIKVGTFPELVLLAETLKFGSEKIPTYQVVSRENGAPHTLLVAYNNFARGGKKPRLWADDRKPLFDQLNTPAVFTTHQAQKMIPRRVEMLRDMLSRIHFLEPRPVNMRGYAPIESNVRLASDGRNVSAVLYDICEQQNKKDSILGFIRKSLTWILSKLNAMTSWYVSQRNLDGTNGCGMLPCYLMAP